MFRNMSVMYKYCVCQVDEGDPPFPRPAGYWWFGCDTLSQPLKVDNEDRRRGQHGAGQEWGEEPQPQHSTQLREGKLFNPSNMSMKPFVYEFKE